MFSVYRSDEAMLPLRQAWEQANDALRTAILRASAALDRLLQKAPHEEGESREGGTRVLLAGPVGVRYEVDQVRKLVRILRAWSYVPTREDRSSAWDV